MSDKERDEMAKILDDVSIFRDKGETRDWQTRQADALIKAGYGSKAEAWREGADYSAAHPIANMADRDRANPYKDQL